MSSTIQLDQQEPTEKLDGDDVETQDDSEASVEEYAVEAIRKKRTNPKTGLVEYLIKWENYPESDNTWEPQEHLKCPEIIARFNEQDKLKEKDTDREKEKPKKLPPNKRRQSETTKRIIIDEDDTSSDTSDDLSAQAEETKVTKGFERGLPLEQIIGSCVDEKDRLYFFVKWRGSSDIEQLDAKELEEKATETMFRWYKEKLYHRVSNPMDQSVAKSAS